MPEGPEVRRVADKLRSKVKGSYLLDVVVYGFEKPGKIQNEFGTKWLLVNNTFPSECLDIITRGKQLYFFFANGICLNSGLGMEGHWYINQMGNHVDVNAGIITLLMPYMVKSISLPSYDFGVDETTFDNRKLPYINNHVGDFNFSLISSSYNNII